MLSKCDRGLYLPVGRLFVYGRSRPDEVRYVRDVHSHLVVAVGQGPAVEGVVNVRATGRVHRAHVNVTTVHPGGLVGL